MAGIGTVDLAAGVAAAGGLGSIGCAAMEPELAIGEGTTVTMRIPLRKRFGVGLESPRDGTQAAETTWVTRSFGPGRICRALQALHGD
jgi:hypothetical protein